MARSKRTSLIIKHHETTLSIPKTGVLRLVVVSDTHSKPHPNAYSLIEGLRPDAILHGVDIGRLEILDELAELGKLIAVRGNIDPRNQGLADSVSILLKDDDTVRLSILLTHIALYGPKLRSDVVRLAKTCQAQLVVCGHSHIPYIGRDQGVSIFNPGSIGPRRKYLPIVFGTVELSSTGVRLKHINCETGEVWSP